VSRKTDLRKKATAKEKASSSDEFLKDRNYDLDDDIFVLGKY